MSEISAKALEETIPESGKRFKWRRYLAFLAIFLLLIYLLSLVLLNTSWAKNKLTNRLRTKSNTDWVVGGVHWVPFGDIQLNDLETSMGEGGVKIKSLSVKLSWVDLISGSVNLMEATVKEAEVDIDLKWLRDNLSNGEEIVELPKLDVIDKPNLTAQPPAPLPKRAGKSTAKTSSKPTQGPAPKPVLAEKPKFNDLPNRWLKVEKMNITLRNGGDVIETLSDLSASIPLAGKPVDGEIRLKFLGDEHIQKVSWDGMGLSAEELAGNIFDVKYQWKLACRSSQPGMPFVFRFTIPQQKLNHTLDKPNVHINISSDKIAANFIINGSLRTPNTWRGILNAGSKNTTITENQKTHKRINFDHTRLVGVIANGALHVPAAEAIGHKVSILANGSVLKNLYSYGVVRLITNDESRKFFEGVYHATRLIHIEKKSSYHLLFPLDTPDRRYCDLFVDGKINDLEIRHNRSDSWQSLNKMVEKLWNFKNNELQEDGLLETNQ
ncbi:MAG: hypothetical protein ACI9E1_001856 [Cryomorphaceae bacterium]